jgi:hypothetical protein
MAVYSIPFELEEILAEVRGKFQKILVIGCGGCTNESLAYIHKIPITNVNGHELTPIATNEELEKSKRDCLRLVSTFGRQPFLETGMLFASGKKGKPSSTTHTWIFRQR